MAANKDHFLHELRELMVKHNVKGIWLEADDSSDWHGIQGERMLLDTSDMGRIEITNGTGFDTGDLQQILGDDS